MIDLFDRVLQSLDLHAVRLLTDGRDPEEAETVALLDTAIGRFGERQVNSAEIDAASCLAPEHLEGAAALGLFGLTTPTAYGGAGLSMKASSRVIRRLAQIDRSLAVSVGLHNGLGLRGLIALGSPALKERYLEDLARGKSIACFAATESESGSEIAATRTTVREDGDALVVDGAKAFVTNGGFANVATVVARSKGLEGSTRGHSLLFVPLDLPGVTRATEENKLGLKGSSTRSIYFDGVRVERHHLLGAVGRGLDHLNHILTWGRTLMAAGCLGLMDSALACTLAHVTTRRQFKRPLSEFGMVREKIASLRSRLFAAESLIRLVTGLEDEQPDSIGIESTVAKVVCSEAACLAADEAVQLHGGSGFIEDTGVPRMLRDIRITRIFEGANEVLRFHLAAAAFTWNQGPPALRLRGLVDLALASEAEAFDDLRLRLAEALARERREHKLRVFQRQMVQRRIAEIVCALYTLLAMLVRAQGEIGRGDSEAVLLARHAAFAEIRAAERALSEIQCNPDELSHRIAAAECSRLGCPLCEPIA